MSGVAWNRSAARSWSAGWLVLATGFLLGMAVLTALELHYLRGMREVQPLLYLLTFCCHLIEAVCLVYATAFVWASVRYVRVHGRGEAAQPVSRRPRTAVVYLCCGDVDELALRSLSELRYGGELARFLHDDSVDPETQREVDELVRRESLRTGVEWRVLRRPTKGGGKPGALGYVLEQIRDEYPYFLLADNDSLATDPGILDLAMSSFDDPRVSIVQFRNRSNRLPTGKRFTDCLSSSIDVFDAFMTGLYQPLWQPFVGHNALLETRAVVDAGGFTPGMFADDIDLTIRLNLAGRRVVYRRDLCMSEGHPPNYRSFCVRSRKWAHGCAQVMRLHMRRVLSSDVMTLRQKFGFLLFSGVYATQLAMVLYVLLVFLLLPLLVPVQWSAAPWALVAATILPLTAFLPVIAFLRTEGRDLPFLRTLLATAATYGSTDLWVALGFKRGVVGQRSEWVPTNAIRSAPTAWLDWLQFLVGILVLLVPLAVRPVLLVFPLTWILAAKFLFVPAVAAYYAPPRPGRARAEARRGGLLRKAASTLLLLFGVGGALLALQGIAQGQEGDGGESRSIELSDGRILVDEEPVLFRGIHYSPWPAGQGPGRGFEYPDAEHLRRDLQSIRAANANAVLVYDASPELLEVAAELDLYVVYTFFVQWWRLPSGEGEAVLEELREDVRSLHDRTAVVIWMVGNEIPGWVIDELGADALRDFLSTARDVVREVDPSRPVCHGNWPNMRSLDLDRDMDLLCYNVYPFYPTEVVTTGYGRFLEEQILPLARGRPLLVGEFGVNTVEASEERQAEILVECWEGLLEAGCAGGFVFEFADEWWKNYDNPIEAPDWWRREEAPDDHLTHDQDPEEHYGIVHDDRRPKPAYAAVATMFDRSARAGVPRVPGLSLWWLGAIAVVAFVLCALLVRLRALRQ